jgi:hypothetical protein
VLVDLWSDALVLETDVDAFKLLEENERIGLRTRVEDLTKRIAQENSFHEHLQVSSCQETLALSPLVMPKNFILTFTRTYIVVEMLYFSLKVKLF